MISGKFQASDKNNTRHRSPGRNFRPVLFVLCFVMLLGIIFYLSGGTGSIKNDPSDIQYMSEARNTLKAMEERAPVNPDDLRKNEEETQILPEYTPEDISELQYSILEHFGDYDYNSENFRRWFEDAAIVGDSLAEAISGFGWIYDQNLQAQVGISLQTCQDVIEGTKQLSPSYIFLTFSANNIATYGVGIETYIDEYSAIIRDLQAAVPWAQIYVEGILPCQPEFMEEYWYYSYLDDYNYAMQVMCDELGVHYFDAGFILNAHPDIYDVDGLHPTWEFYPLWLTYMAEISGLSSR